MDSCLVLFSLFIGRKLYHSVWRTRLMRAMSEQKSSQVTLKSLSDSTGIDPFDIVEAIQTMGTFCDDEEGNRFILLYPDASLRTKLCQPIQGRLIRISVQGLLSVQFFFFFWYRSEYILIYLYILNFFQQVFSFKDIMPRSFNWLNDGLISDFYFYIYSTSVWYYLIQHALILNLQLVHHGYLLFFFFSLLTAFCFSCDGRLETTTIQSCIFSCTESLIKYWQ